jgi:hypothetical protein
VGAIAPHNACIIAFIISNQDHIMIEPSERGQAPPHDRLERWLVRKIQGGGLKSLPGYDPLHGPSGRSAEAYALALLAALRRAQGDLPALERLSDDGRAFRSWAERAGHAHVAAG